MLLHLLEALKRQHLREFKSMRRNHEACMDEKLGIIFDQACEQVELRMEKQFWILG